MDQGLWCFAHNKPAAWLINDKNVITEISSIPVNRYRKKNCVSYFDDLGKPVFIEIN
jgi:hypothetical protein